MVVRRLQYIVNSNEITPASEQFAGSQGDKSATAVDFALTDDLLGLVNQENIYYRFDGYDAEGNVLRGDSAPLDNDNLSYVVSEQLTRFGGKIQVYLIITQSVEGKTEMELYNFPARMRLNSLPSGSEVDKAEYESLTTLAESAKGAADKLFGDNVFVFGGGNAYDENIWPPTTDEVYNPETNLVQSKRPITSKGVYAAFKAFYERIIREINDKFSLHTDYIVEEGITEDGWGYIKRNNGSAECWAEVSGTETVIGINVMTIKFPLYFIEGSFRVNATPARNATQVSWYGECDGAGNPQRGSGYCYFSYKLTSEHKPTFNVHVVGMWKR